MKTKHILALVLATILLASCNGLSNPFGSSTSTGTTTGTSLALPSLHASLPSLPSLPALSAPSSPATGASTHLFQFSVL